MNWLQGLDLGLFNTSLPTMAMVGWLAWHLNGKFNKIDLDVKKLLDTHEDKDQFRHEANLLRFERISVALARLGLTDGSYGKEKTIEST